MCSSAALTELPDAVVNAIRRASRAFESLQSSRYPASGIGSSSSPAAAANGVSSKHALVMRTKTHVPGDDHPVLDAAGSAPSRWSEIYRSAVAEVVDEPSQRLWGLVSVVLSVLEHGGTADDVNASAEIVAWGDRSSTALDDVDELLSTLHASHPQQMSEDAVEDLGPVVLGRIEEAFLTGHFDVAATLIDALLVFARRGRPRLLSADVEASLADVKRLLATGFHDHDSYARYWVPSANSLVVEWRADLYDAMVANENTGIEDIRGVNQLVWDLCATCKDLLLLITQDAELLVQRCLKSRRSAADFLVAICAVMKPYAALSHVAAIFAQYVGRWTEEEWWNTSALAVLEAATLHDVVGAMATVANNVNEAVDDASGVPAAATPSVGRLNGGVDGDASDADDDSNDDDSVLSDTVSLSELVEHALPVTPAFARRFTVACMTAHVADLCAPVGIAASAADIHLTFTRNDLVAAYASLFAAQPRTWRVAGLYACYSPLINPRFVADVVQGMTPLAATDDITYRSLKAFLRTSWCPHSALQSAVRARLEAVLPGNATVERWWAAVEVYHSESVCTLHRYVINTWWNSGSWGRAAWLAVEMGMTDTLQSHLRQMLCDAGALGNGQLYAVGLAVQHQLVGFDTSRAPELTRYLCAAAAVAMYRQGATAVRAAHQALAHAAAPDADTPTAAEVLRAEVACVEAVQTALTCADACEAMLHPVTTFKLVEHGAELLLSLRQRMCNPTTGDTTESMDVSSTVLPLLVEAYQLSSIHFALSDSSFSARTHALATKLARLHQAAL